MIKPKPISYKQIINRTKDLEPLLAKFESQGNYFEAYNLSSYLFEGWKSAYGQDCRLMGRTSARLFYADTLNSWRARTNRLNKLAASKS